MEKSASLKVETGKTLAEFEHSLVDHRRTPLLGFIVKVIALVRRDRKETSHDD